MGSALLQSFYLLPKLTAKENVALLGLLGAELDDTLSPDIKAQDAGDEVPIIPMPIKATPYQHQVRAYNFALRTFGIGGTP